jgi:Tol biopolymer transport system component
VLKNAANATISPDGRTFAFFREASESKSQFGLRRELWLSPVAGGEPRRYMEPPFDKTSFVDSVMSFSPDGSKLLLWGWGWYTEQTHIPATRFWLIPWPNGKPSEVLPSLTGATPAAVSFDWLPDSRNIVVSLWDPATTGMHLWTADIERDTRTPVTATVGSENWPNVTADGRRMAFASESIDFDLVDIPLDGTPLRKLFATSRNESEPTFNRDGTRYAYASDKGGILRVWARSRTDPDVETVVVDPDQFPSGEATLALGALSMSPDGERVAYQRYSDASGYRIWISTVRAAGPPVPLTTGLFYEDAPTWSPDGGSIAFIMRSKEYVSGLAIQRVGTGAEPTIVLSNVIALGVRPQWSPDGRWIVCDTDDGAMIVTPDGKNKRVISEEFWLASAWAADSKHVYVLREADKLHHFALTSIDIDSLQERVINPDLGPIPHASQPIRGLTLSGSGTVSTSVATARSDIWVMEDFVTPKGLLDRLLPWR